MEFELKLYIFSVLYFKWFQTTHCINNYKIKNLMITFQITLPFVHWKVCLHVLKPRPEMIYKSSKFHVWSHSFITKLPPGCSMTMPLLHLNPSLAISHFTFESISFQAMSINENITPIREKLNQILNLIHLKITLLSHFKELVHKENAVKIKPYKVTYAARARLSYVI